MIHQNEGPFSLTAGEALEEARFVKLSAATAVYADAGDEPIGLTANAVASGEMVAVIPLDSRVRRVTAAGVISAGSAIYPAADGKVSDAAVGKQIGINLTASTAAGGRMAAVVWGPRGGNDMLSAKGSLIEFFHDFFTYDVTNDFAVVEDAGAAVGDAITDANGGVVNIGPDGDDNDEIYVSSKNEIFKFQTDKKLFFEARVKITEGNTDDQNCIIGLSDTVAADSLLDDGGGPMAAYIGAAFFKVDGGTKWQFETSNGATQNTLADLVSRVSGTWVKLGFLYDYNDGTTAKVTPFIDGVAYPAQNLTIAGVAEMHVLLGVKQGGTGTEEAMLVDYFHVVAER